MTGPPSRRNGFWVSGAVLASIATVLTILTLLGILPWSTRAELQQLKADVFDRLGVIERDVKEILRMIK